MVCIGQFGSIGTIKLWVIGVIVFMMYWGYKHYTSLRLVVKGYNGKA